MKKLIAFIILATGFSIFSPAQAQTKIKLGHIDFAVLYSMMPGLDSVKKEFEIYNKSIQDQYAAMQSELENKFMDYQANMNTMSEIIRSTKEAEINDLKERIIHFHDE